MSIVSNLDRDEGSALFVRCACWLELRKRLGEREGRFGRLRLEGQLLHGATSLLALHWPQMDLARRRYGSLSKQVPAEAHPEPRKTVGGCPVRCPAGVRFLLDRLGSRSHGSQPSRRPPVLEVTRVLLYCPSAVSCSSGPPLRLASAVPIPGPCGPHGSRPVRLPWDDASPRLAHVQARIRGCGYTTRYRIGPSAVGERPSRTRSGARGRRRRDRAVIAEAEAREN